MRKTLLSAALASAMLIPALGQAQAPQAAQSPHTFTGNVGFFTDYRFRGISQTFLQPAIQGGFDYSHSGGFYLGTWASNVNGARNASGLGVNYDNGNMEWDFYGGYKWEVAKDLTLDLGILYYWYPDAKWFVTTKDKYNNTEIYLGGTWKWFSLKYSHATSNYFGIKGNTVGVGAVPGTGACGVDSAGAATLTCAGPTNAGSKGSYYLDFGVNFDLGDKLTLIGHIGHAKVKNYGLFDYTDYKVGLTKEWGGFLWGVSLIDSNAKDDVYRTTKASGDGTLKVKDTAKGTVVFSVQKTF